MRIAHVTDVFLPRLGGIEMQVHDLASRQLARGHDVEVLTREPAGGLTAPDPAWVRRVATDTRPALQTAAAVSRVGRLVTSGEYDAVHVHVSVLSPFGTAAAQAAGRAGLPTVITMHSLWSGLGPLPRMAELVLGLREWPVVWSGVSDKAADPLRRMLGRGRTVQVLPNGIDAERWEVEHQPRRPGVVTVVSVMRLAPRKRPIQLLKIMHRVRRLVPDDIAIQMVVVGDGPLQADMAHYLQSHGMSGWVELPGRLERSQIRQVFASADLYVAPARLESFGIAALEARSAGIPVVASARGGVGEFIEHGREGLLADDDGEMATALAEIVQNHGRREAMTAFNRATPPRVTWDMVLDRADDLYAQAAGVAARTVSRRTFAGR